MIRRKEIDVEVFEGGILSWDSGEMPYQNMCEALVAIDRPKLIPDPAGFKAGSFDSAVTSFANKPIANRNSLNGFHVVMMCPTMTTGSFEQIPHVDF